MQEEQQRRLVRDGFLPCRRARPTPTGDKDNVVFAVAGRLGSAAGFAGKHTPPRQAHHPLLPSPAREEITSHRWIARDTFVARAKQTLRRGTHTAGGFPSNSMQVLGCCAALRLPA